MKVIGFGKGASGKGHVHAVIGFFPEEGIAEIPVALCDKRNQNLVIDKKLKRDAVTCPKCSKHSLVTGPTKTEKPKTEAKPKAESKKVVEFKKPTGKVKKTGDVNHFVASKTQSGSYTVFHLPSGKTFFDGIDARVAPCAIDKLNELKVKWEADQPLPDKFIFTVRDVVKACYKAIKIKPPKHLTADPRKQKKKQDREGDKRRVEVEKGKFTFEIFDGKEWIPEAEWKKIRAGVKKKAEKKSAKAIKKAEKKKKAEKPKQVIRRRGKDKADKPKAESKESKRKIRRRTTEGNEHGQIIGKPPALVADMMKTGATLRQIVDSLMSNFSLSEKRAVAKVKGLTRKFVRQRGFLVNVSMKSDDEMNDHYRIIGKESKEPETTIRRRKK